jgi:hypothetical protein
MRFGRNYDLIERIKRKRKTNCLTSRFPDRPSSYSADKSLPSGLRTLAFPAPVPRDIVFINGTRLEHAG